MSDVQITVQGSFAAYHPAERATVHFQVAFEGPEKTRVHSQTAQAAADVAAGIKAMHAPDRGPVTWWASDQVRAWSARPWNKDGKQLPLVYHATVPFRAKFSDFERLSGWLTDASVMPGISIDRIEWSLTAARRAELVQRARERAVRDARDRAQAYADALGLGAVKVTALAEPGLLGNQRSAETRLSTQFSRGSAAGSAGGAIQFVPEDIEVSARVDAIFTTG